MAKQDDLLGQLSKSLIAARNAKYIDRELAKEKRRAAESDSIRKDMDKKIISRDYPLSPTPPIKSK